MKKLTLLSALLASTLTFAQEYERTRPVFLYGNLEKINRITNLNPADGQKFELDQNSNNFKVELVQKAYLSMGAASEFFKTVESVAGGGIWSAIGIFPLFDGYVASVRQHSEVPYANLSIPKNQQELLNWDIGDVMFYKVQGGIGIYAAIGNIINGIGPRLQLSGDFRVYLEKKSDKDLYVEVKTDRIRDYSIIAGNYLGFAEIAKSVEKVKKGFAFQIDLTTSEGERALRAILRGRIDEAQDISTEQEKDNTFYIAEIAENKLGRARKFGVGTPFVPVISYINSKESSQWSQTRTEANGNVIERDEYTIYRQHKTRLFKYKKYQNQQITFILDNEKNLKNIEAVWTYESTNTSQRRLAKALNSLQETVGDHPILNIMFTDSSDKSKIGYGSAEFRVQLNTATLMPENKFRYLINNYKDTKELRYLNEIASLIFYTPKMMKEFIKLDSSCSGKVSFDAHGLNFKQIKAEKNNCEFIELHVTDNLELSVNQ